MHSHGGDFNSRPGDVRQFGNNKSWIHTENRDKTSNKHGRTDFCDLCSAGNVKPVNGLKYRGLTFDNDFTFIRKNGKSQIDFCFTNANGKTKIKNFDIADFHISDHRPIALVVEIGMEPGLTGIYKRAIDLNYEYNPVDVDICKFRGNYDYDEIQKNSIDRKHVIETCVYEKLHNDDINGAIDLLDEHLKSAHKGYKKETNVVTNPVINMENVNRAFDEYITALSDNTISEPATQILLDRYISARKSVTREMMNLDAHKWNDILKSNDTKTFWRYVDWKGNYSKSKKMLNPPSIVKFKIFFEELYKCDNQRELYDLMEIKSDVNIPVLDEPSNENEIIVAWKAMKKSGFDYNLPILSVLITFFGLMLVHIMNMMFYVKYPVTLACSLLSLIPKKGNLMLPKNFRGIQMMKS